MEDIPMKTRQGTILLVEDNPDDVALALRAFKKADISNEIRVVSDGAEALDYLFFQGPYAGRGENARTAIVLLDINLPKIGGIEVLKRVRADDRTRRLPIIMLTSSKEEQDLVDAYDHGVNSYVRKPVDFIQFAEAARQIGLYWLLLNEEPPTPVLTMR